MENRYIRNQDGDKVYPLDIMSLHPLIRTDLGNTIQLIMRHNNKTVLLGDFKSMTEVVAEISSICDSRESEYQVSGYSNGGFAKW